MLSGFYCSVDTSRIKRVGTRICVVRVAAVSQENVPVCVTPKMTRGENDMVSVLTSKLTWVVKMDLNSVWEVGINLISVWGSEWTWFSVGVEDDLGWSLDRNCLGFSCRRASKLTQFWSRNKRVLVWRIEMS